LAFYLMKSEPEVFSIQDLADRPGRREGWDGVRNYQARNFMMKMELEEPVLFYHSNTKVPGIAGLAKVVRQAYPDISAQDPGSHYFDPKASPENPRWFQVDLELVEIFENYLPLELLKADPVLEGFVLLRPGNRLSVMELSREHFQHILALAGSRYKN